MADKIVLLLALSFPAKAEVLRILAAGFGDEMVTFDFDSLSGQASFVHRQNIFSEGAEGAAWMEYEEASRDLFVVHDSTGHFEEQPESGVLTRWRKAENGLDWELKEYKPSGGRQPLHVTADTEGMLLFVSNFYSSSLVVYSLSDKAEGGISIGEVTFKEVFETGSILNVQKHGQIHATYLLPDKKIVILALGADKLYHFKSTEDGGNITKVQEPNYSTAVSPGSGPRHMIFNNAMELAYVIGELQQTVEVFSSDFLKDSTDGGWFTSLKLVKYELAVNLDNEMERGADIVLHPSGKWLYLCHRGSGSLVVFDVVGAEDGYLLQKQSVAPAGSTPRHFLLTPNGRFMAVALRDKSDIEIFEIDQDYGTISSRGTVDFDGPQDVVVMAFI